MRLSLLLGCLLAVGFGWGASAGESLAGYKGADAGKLIVSVAVDDMMSTSVTVRFRKVGDSGSDSIVVSGGARLLSKADASQPQFDPVTQSLIQKTDLVVAYPKNDISVEVLGLAPGDYEIYEVDVHGGRYSTYSFTWDQKIRIHPVEFRVTAGKATYLGRFSVVAATRPQGLWHIQDLDHWVLVLDDQADFDIPIAMRRDAQLGPVDRTTGVAPTVFPSKR